MKIVLEEFADYLENKGLKDKTVEEYIYYFTKFYAKYQTFNQESVSLYLMEKRHRNVVSRAFLMNLRKYLIQSEGKYQIGEKEYSNIASVELPTITGSKKQRLVIPLSEEQIKNVERALESELDKLRLLVSYYCGLRLGELVKIEMLSFNWEVWKHSREDYGEVRVFGKGDKEGIALVPPFLMTRVAKYIRSKKWKSTNDKVFLVKGKEKNLKNQSRAWQLSLREAGINAGITQLDANGDVIKKTALYPHKLRHSHATSLLEKGVDLRKIQESLRHTSIQSTQIYTHVSKSQLKKEFREKGFGIEEQETSGNQEYQNV